MSVQRQIQRESGVPVGFDFGRYVLCIMNRRIQEPKIQPEVCNFQLPLTI